MSLVQARPAMIAGQAAEQAVQGTPSEPCNGGGPFPFVWSLDRSSDVGRALLAADRRLAEAGSDSPQLDSVVLMAHVLGVSKTWLYAHPTRHLSEKEIESYETLVRRRMCHEPVAYLVGYKPFFGLDITVDNRVLIPRPETELLVERVLGHAQQLIEEGRASRIADIGTGSGAIAVALAVNTPGALIYATDVSDDALSVAAQNVWRYGVGDQVQLLPGHLLDPLPEPVDIVVANLPYVATEELPDLPADVRNHEPRLALDGGPGGLAVIEAALRDIAEKPALRAKLSPGCRIYLEIGSRQGQAVRELAARLLPQARFDLYLDYADLDRVAMITL
jgi:release factor glutamine methyltransferase